MKVKLDAWQMSDPKAIKCDVQKLAEKLDKYCQGIDAHVVISALATQLTHYLYYHCKPRAISEIIMTLHEGVNQLRQLNVKPEDLD